MKVLKFLIFFFFLNAAYSQSNKALIDSLKIELTSKINDTARAKILGDLTWYYKEFSVDSALKYGKQGLDLIKKLNDKKLLAQQYSDVAGVYLISGDTKLSEEYYKAALNLRKELKDTLGVAKIGANLMAFYIKFNQPDSAMIYGLNAINIFEDKKILNYSNILKSNLASLHRSLRNYQKALDYNFEVLAYSKEIKDDVLTSNIYTNIGTAYSSMDNSNKAIKYYNLAIEECKKINNFRNLSIALNGLTLVYFETNQIKKGIETANEALKYKSFLNSELEIASLNYVLGEQYFQLSQIKKSKTYLLEALPYFEKNTDKLKVVRIYHFLSIIYGIERNKNLAIQFKLKSDSLSESYFNEKNSKELVELEVKYQSEKAEKDLLEIRTEKAETELALSKTKGWVFVLIGSLFIVLVLFFAINQRIKRKTQEALLKQKEEGLQAVIQAEENERTRIARELHDGVVQQIGSVILKSRNVLDNLKALEEPESKELLKNLEESNQDLRNISHQMMPRALNELGIVAALKDLLNGSLGLTDTQHNFEYFNISERLSQKIEVTIYRVVQELISNIIKHSKATEVSVQLFKAGRNIILIVEDNGVGISDEKPKKGIGLLNISSRLDMVKGEVNFEPSPQSGTLVTVKIPT